MDTSKFILRQRKIYCDVPFTIIRDNYNFTFTTLVPGYRYPLMLVHKEVSNHSVLLPPENEKYVFEHTIPDYLNVNEISSYNNVFLEINDLKVHHDLKVHYDLKISLNDNSNINCEINTLLNLDLFTFDKSKLNIKAPIDIIRAEIMDQSSVIVTSPNKVKSSDIVVCSHYKTGAILQTNFVGNTVSAFAIGNYKILGLNIESNGQIYSTNTGFISGSKLPTTKMYNWKDFQSQIKFDTKWDY